MKKLLFVLMLLVCFMLVSCDNKTGEEEVPVTEQTLEGTKPEVTIPEETEPGVITPTPIVPTKPNPTEPTPTEPEVTNPVTPDQTPIIPVDPNLPILSAGYCDTGYAITVSEDGVYTIDKKADAVLWGGAMLDVNNYSSPYSAFDLNITTTSVTNFTIELIISGGEVDWAENVSVYQTTLSDGTHDIHIDFTETHPVSTITWDYVTDCYIKDYQIVAIKFVLDTGSSAELNNKSATCVVNELTFEKIGSIQTPPAGGGDVPETPTPDLNAPTTGAGYCDTGYSITTSNNEFVINKDASAILWGGAMLGVYEYTSAYSAFNLKITTTNITNFTIELIISGGEPDWAENISVYHATLSDGTHEINIDFTETHPVSTSTWDYVTDYYIKDYEITAIKFVLDTGSTEELNDKDATCVINELSFVKIGNSTTPDPDPTPEEKPDPVDPNAPTTSVGYADTGYKTVFDEETGKYTITKSATAQQWTSATLDILGYTSAYSSFSIKFTTTNVTKFSIQLYVEGGETDWAHNVSVFQATLEDGLHEITVDFTYEAPVSTSNWEVVPGYYIKDLDVVGIQIVMDTQDLESLNSKDATCIIHQLTFKKVENDGKVEDEMTEYVPSNTALSFSDKNTEKVITEPTFDVELYTENAGSNIKLFQLFSSGMCIQRDAVNRIWGTAKNTNNIAIQIKDNVYYGTVKDGQFEVYLPKMNAGGPYNFTIISEAGRITLTNVYIGEVFLCSGQSNMEWRPQDAGDVLKDLYSTSACINSEIRMLNVGWGPNNEPSMEVANYWQWKGANQTTIPAFTAVGYLFGKQMQEELGCPVGLISNPIGGSSIEFWLSEENYNKVQDIYTSYTTTETYMTPCLGYNGMLYPLTGINLRGVIWYQGESNAFGTQEYYDQALKIYMEQCRKMFDNEQLSFTICELARYKGLPYEYSIVNEKINLVASTDPYVVVARNLDLGEWNDIHPKDKREIARRAAYETLRTFFNIEKEAPVVVSDYTFNEDGSVTINLSRDANLLNGTNGFEVYVNGSYTYDCNVSIEGNKLTVTANGTITKVRYGYTCKMTSEIMKDVSKMVTVYDENGFPLDLFLISK